MKKTTTNSSNGSLKFLILYLLSSFFAALLFSLLVIRARKKGNYGIGWFLLALMCIALFGFIGELFVKTSSPTHDAGYYYLGQGTLLANGIACFLLICSFFVKRYGIDS
jgi:hypothetical protein